jgi:glutamate racemase
LTHAPAQAAGLPAGSLPLAREAPVGVFDSGVGGLTVLKALLAVLPHERFIYLGDTARLPYGSKSPETVAAYAVQAARLLAAQGVKCLVVACNTASSAGLAAIRERLPGLPVAGVIEPGAAAACEVSLSGSIAVLATEGTVRGGAYQAAIRRRRPEAAVTTVAAPLFVALAEEGLVEGPIALAVVRHYLLPLLEQQAPDTLVLGCTHFPMLAAAIREVAGEGIQLVDSAATAAAWVREQLATAGLAAQAGPVPAGSGEPRLRLLATDGPERFGRVGSLFLARDIPPAEVELVDLTAG